MSTGTLYEASQTYQAAWDLVYDAAVDGLITQDLKCIIDSVQDDLNSKLETFATLVTELESDAEQCKKEAARLAGRAKRFSDRAEELRALMKITMEDCGVGKVKGEKFDISIRKNPGAAEIFAQDMLPSRFLEEVVTVKVLKSEINKALKSGETVPGAEIRESTRLEIR